MRKRDRQALLDIAAGARYPRRPALTYLAPLYTWLTGQATKPDGPGDIKWNFAKFLVDKTGQVAARFEPKTAPTAPEVKQAVETLFKVKVTGVRTATVEGKERRRGKFSGYRPDWKKAYVRLKDGEKMPEYLDSL